MRVFLLQTYMWIFLLLHTKNSPLPNASKLLHPPTPPSHGEHPRQELGLRLRVLMHVILCAILRALLPVLVLLRPLLRLPVPMPALGLSRLPLRPRLRLRRPVALRPLELQVTEHPARGVELMEGLVLLIVRLRGFPAQVHALSICV